MLRGINRQNIFEDDEDRNRFMTILTDCRDLSDFRLHAFVLMSNHIHLLIEPRGESLAVIFKRIGTRYAVWYNRKYQRAGHLFQDRFRSECVTNDQYYYTVFRYILQNPMKAGLESRPGTYRWSSFLAYEKGRSILTDTEYALSLFENRRALLDFVAQKNDDSVMDEADHDWRLRDDTAKEIIKRVAGCSSVSDFQQLDAKTQREYARKLYQESLSMGQIARLTGLTKSSVYRAVHHPQNKTKDPNPDPMLLQEPSMAESFFDPDIIW